MGKCSPSQILARWFQATFLGNFYRASPDDKMPAHTEGHDRNLPVETQIQSLRMSGPLDGAIESASCWLPFVSLCPPLYMLWAVLTQVVGFALKP
jgi:hypothetical protein